MVSGKTALITGIGGQDGSYLAELLLEKGYKVRGVVRRASTPNTHRIDHLLEEYGQETRESRFYLRYADLSDGSSLRTAIEEFRPDEIYNLAAQSHVGISFNNPESTLDINGVGPLRILEAIRDMRLETRLYQASSSEMFGSSPPPQNEDTPFSPKSPYGVAKLAAFHLTRVYRDAYGVFASNGILFNHESPRRGITFVTRKITLALADMILGRRDNISLGNLDAKRDWGFAGEYVQAMWSILQHKEPDDFVISTGETHTVRDFARECFGLVGLESEKYLVITDRYKRPAEVPALLGDSSKARRVLGWDPQVKFKGLVRMMLVADLRKKFGEEGIVGVKEGRERDDDYFIQTARELAERRGLK